MAAGSRARNRAREFYGFTEKVARALGDPDFNMSDDDSQTRVHNLTHHWSTRAVWRELWRDKTTTTRPKSTIAVPVSNRYDYRCAFIPMEFVEDVIIRLDTFGAGWAALDDMKAALLMMAQSPLYIHNPGISQVVPLCNLYTIVEEDPLRYGIASRYPTSAPGYPRFDKVPYSTLIAAIVSWLRVFLPHSSIAGATPFLGDPAEMVGYDSGWYDMCVAARAAQAQALKATPQKMIDLFTATGHIASLEVPDGLVRSLVDAGIPVTAYQFQRSINAMTGLSPPNPPARPGNPHASAGSIDSRTLLNKQRNEHQHKQDYGFLPQHIGDAAYRQ